MTGPDGASRDAWVRLVAALDAWASAAEVAPGRIEVTLPGSGRRVVVVMTPEEWRDGLVGIAFGSESEALRHVVEILSQLGPDESYAVYSQYVLEPSAGPTLPEEDDPPSGPGEWVVLDRAGHVVSRFADWHDPDEEG